MRLRLPVAVSLASIVLAVLAVVVFAQEEGPPPPPQLPVVLIQDDFADRDLGGWTLEQADHGRIRVAPSPGRRSGLAVRFEVRHRDRIGGDSGGRSELSWSAVKFAEGDTVVFRWSTYVPRTYPKSGGWQVITQWKGEGDGGPPLELWLERGRIGMGAGPQAGHRQLWSRPMRRGRWYDHTARVHFSESPRRGWVEVRQNGRRVLRRTRVQTLAAGRNSYFKLGLYRQGSIRPTGVVFHTGVHVALD
jgi:Polysaccharide lyase